jgi:serine/threonine protein kinase/Flp pilus assembly protein TadD
MTAVATQTYLAPIKTLESGTIFSGKYKIIEKLGRGGMGTVYKAEDTKLKRTVALKFLAPALTGDTEARERFIHEAQAASALDHPNICTVHEVDETEEGEMYISMAFYKGESLKERIKKKPLELEEIVDIAIQVAGGLTKAHEEGIVHRDVKSANIMITEEGLVKIVDFGLAKLSGLTRITKLGIAMGTIDYMSPEQARGEEVDERTDIWSLGIILYEMISGKLPFKGAHEQAVVYSILNEEPAPVRGLSASIPLELEKIMRKALSKNAAKRFTSVEEMSTALKELKAKVISGESLTTIQLIFRKSRKRLLIGGVAAVLLLAALSLTWIFTRPSLAFSSYDKLLVADVDNQTEDSVFDLALRTAIEADLQQSPYASIFDKGQIAETLRLMRIDPSSQIDEDLGYDICRFAGVRAMILPRILSVGEAYELQAILVDPRRKRHVDRIRVTAKGREDVLLNAIDKMAREIRSRLGESMKSIQEADRTVIKVTTSSWEALHYLSLGQAKWHEGKYKDAAAFFELALDKDPAFSSARGTLGLLQLQWLNQKEKGKETLKRALADAENLSQRELLLIKAINKTFVEEDLEGALAEYRMIIELFPDNMQAYNNSGMILRSLGRVNEAVTMYTKAHEILPSNTVPLSNLWWTHLFFSRNPQAAEEAARRLVELGPEIALYNHCLGYSLLAQARFDEAVEAYKKTVDLEPQHAYGLPNLAHALLSSGRAAEAAPVYREIRDLVNQGRMQGTYTKASFDLAFALAESGDHKAANEIAAEGRDALLKLLDGETPNAQNLLVLGQLEAVSGKIIEAEQYLIKALEIEILDPYSIRNDPQFRALFNY